MSSNQTTDLMASITEAINEAKRCLHCKVPQCRKGCPINNDIPGFIQELSKGNFGTAMSIINETSDLPAICGRVCPHEKQCQGNCILGKTTGEPVKIGKLESFIADFDTGMRLMRENIPQKTRGRVAVIGSGPAGLTVAANLARQGFHVTIFEGEQELGGVLLYGIPEYRLPKDLVRAELEKIHDLGVEFLTGKMVGREGLTVDSIFADGYDAIFIGTGTAVPQTLDIPGDNLRGVNQSLYLLHQVAAFNEGAISRWHVPVDMADKVAIIGGGNVAMDAARTALRFGADVTVIYRGTREKMPASDSEYNEAVNEGIKFRWESTPKKFIGKNGCLTGIMIDTPEGEQTLDFTRVFLAIGSRPANRIVSTTEGIEVDDKGYVITTDRPMGMTTRRGVFAAGDVVHRPQTVVLAMKAAQQVARGIAQYVDAVKLIEHVGNISSTDAAPSES